MALCIIDKQEEQISAPLIKHADVDFGEDALTAEKGYPRAEVLHSTETPCCSASPQRKGHQQYEVTENISVFSLFSLQSCKQLLHQM